MNLMIALIFLMMPSFSNAAATMELVQTVPLETDLGVSGVRDTQQVWVEMIQKAQTSIDLEQFYVSDEPGEALTPVLAAIRSAAARGVKIRLLIDSKFYATYPNPSTDLGKLNNIQLKIIDYSSHGGGIQHAKFFIVDGRDSFVGSHNFDWRALSHIHEVGLRVTDVAVAAKLKTIFEKDWSEAEGKTKASVSEAPITSAATASIRVVASPAQTNPAGIADTFSQVIELIETAKTSLRLQVMEFSTHMYGNKVRWILLDSALKAAAARGVQVEIIVDASNVKKANDDLVSLAQTKNIQLSVVTIPQFSGGPIPFARLVHSKYLIKDNTTFWVGSENWSEGYFTKTRNVGLVVDSSLICTQLSKIFDHLWQSPYSSLLR